jgi:hypothetical protein
MSSFVFSYPKSLLTLLLALLVIPISAQETMDRGSVSGVVVDPSGAVVVNASVIARQVETNVTTTTLTDNQGRFRFPYLKVGYYEIKVHHQGFAAVTRSVALTVGAAFELPVSLSVNAAEETISVDGEAAVVETAAPRCLVLCCSTRLAIFP